MNNEERKRRLQIPAGKIRLVIDTDAKNEVDDQFAIAWALKSPERFQVEAVYAAPFSHKCMGKVKASEQDIQKSNTLIGTSAGPADGMRQSYDEIVKLYKLMGIESKNHVFHGAEQYIDDTGMPVESDAVRDLIRRARQSDDILYVAAIGVITNIASAILIAPDIIEKIVIVWLGGQPLEFGHAIEFNTMQDVKASQVVFDSGVPLVLIPCMNVASLISVSGQELLECLHGKSDVGTYLYNIVKEGFQDIEAEKAFMSVDRGGYLLGREDYEEEYLGQFQTEHISWSRIIWDISVIAFLKNPNWVVTRYENAPRLENNLKYATEGQQHLIRVANYCWRNFIFGDMFYCLADK